MESHTGTGSNGINKNIVQTDWKKLINLIWIDDLQVCVCFRILENIAIAVLFGTISIDRCTWMIFQFERKGVPFHLRAVAIINIITAKTAINSIYGSIAVFNVNKASNNDALHDGYHLCHAGRQITRNAYKTVPVLLSCQSSGSWQLGPLVESSNTEVPWPWEV